MNISSNLTLAVTNFNQRPTTTFAAASVTSGSNVQVASINITTGSWTTIPTGSNADLLVGSFTNNDTIDNVYIAFGATTNTASILTPTYDTCLIPYSGSVQPYAKAVGSNGTCSLSYTLVSYN